MQPELTRGNVSFWPVWGYPMPENRKEDTLEYPSVPSFALLLQAFAIRQMLLSRLWPHCRPVLHR